MTVELRPLGVRCNLACTYCYQQPQRDAGNAGASYDMAAMRRAVAAEGGPFTVFGGEPLLVPYDDLDALLAWGHERFGHSGLQTNGTLLTERHVAMFRRHGVRVGVSVDGPGSCNDRRRSANDAVTVRATERTHAAIRRLCAEGMPPGIIVTLHRGNATGSALDEMCAWFGELSAIGVRSVRLHLLEVDGADVRRDDALTDAENIAALDRFAAVEPLVGPLSFDLFGETRSLLEPESTRRMSCVWRACDPYTTPAVRGVEGDGRRTNCGRTNKEGIDFVKASTSSYERAIALYHTPQQDGGCQGCRFFAQCRGHCPGTGVDGDWRNRSEHCAVWFAQFERAEADLLAAGATPASLDPARVEGEATLVDYWAHGVNPSGHLAAAPADGRARWSAPRIARGDAADPGLLGFAMPDFLRVAWVSDAARATWEPRLRAIAAAMPAAVVRYAAEVGPVLARLPAAGYFAAVERAAAAGLAAVAVRLERAVADEVVRPSMAPRWVTVAVGGPELRRLERLDGAGTAALADEGLLPECCHVALAATYGAGWTDPTWRTASRAAAGADVVELDGNPDLRLFLAPVGVRAVGFPPCSFDCEAAAAIARDVRSAVGDVTTTGAGQWLGQALSWPVEWTSLHGIAEVRAPVVKIAAPTDPVARVLTIRVDGAGDVEHAARGLRHPYDRRGPVPLTLGRRPSGHA